ncbi:LEM domain-containing protein 1 isoform X5 [Salmo salar]|uniref:LEM domain-containing protein 1 isoform X5 n=1 Tax=Salmo salar TaxID=8030 RepID=A0A1S3MFN6_SALSA|nr:LEM domain-containing protein 1 isoform X5 [Salmo salar]|eukprot:XP_014002007.1 PREDICTED: lamina-associated polypeptide 2, isoforms beta/delta/epsilon/gamma-like isoform X5 [Salmo salar]
MPVFVEDPAQFSKPRLKSELIAHNVTLPAVESKKQVYVELYLKHIVQKSAADFSSDEEDDDVVEVQDSQDFEEEEKDPEMLDPSVLTDDKLKTTLLKYGVEAGPIVGSQQGSPETVSLMEENLHVDMWFESRIPLSSSGPEIKRGNNRSSNQGPCPRPYWQEAATVDKYTMTNRSLFITPKTSLFKRQIKEPVTDVLMEMFPETEPTPTGIAATRRRPIKGAAGRPVQFKYPDLPASPMTLQRWAVEPRLVPLWVQILVFFIVACLLYLIYASMEDGLANPFVALLDNLSMETETEGLSLQAEP